MLCEQITRRFSLSRQWIPVGPKGFRCPRTRKCSPNHLLKRSSCDEIMLDSNRAARNSRPQLLRRGTQSLPNLRVSITEASLTPMEIIQPNLTRLLIIQRGYFPRIH